MKGRISGPQLISIHSHTFLPKHAAMNIQCTTLMPEKSSSRPIGYTGAVAAAQVP
jgi:hypothetical protein